MDDNFVPERDDEGFADCDSPEDDTMETNVAAEGDGKYVLSFYFFKVMKDIKFHDCFLTYISYKGDFSDQK